MNEIQNKLLHYRTKASFNADKNAGKISDTSIAFVDEGHIIYTHGIEYTTDVAFLLAEVNQRINDVVAEFESNIDNAVASLREESLENHQDVIQLTRAAIEDAKSKILQVLNMIESDYVQTSEIQNINGRISAIVDWFAVQELKFTRLEQSIDAVSGQIVTSGEYTSVAQLVVNTYKQTVDASLAQLREEILSINVSELTNTVIGRLLDAENGVLKDYATTAWVSSLIEGVGEADITNKVEQVLNSMTPSWSTIVSQVTSNSNSNNLITQEISRLWVEANKISGLSTSVNDHSSRIAALELNSGGDGAQVSLGAIMDILDNDAERKIASEIFLTANENGSGITLAADKIDLSGNTTVLGTFVSNIIQATLIDARSLTVGSGSNFIKADATNGLYHINTSTNRNSFKLNPNGSGQLGYVVTEVDGQNVYTPALSWTSNGVLTINSAIIGEGGGGTTYVENSYDDTSITNRLDTIEAWKSAMTTTENARAYLTSTGIVFDNISNSGQIVSVTSTPYSASRVIPAGVAHTKVSDGTHGYYLKNDGGGELAFGNITWDAQGNLYAKNFVIDSNTSGAQNSTTIFQIVSWYRGFITYKIIKNGLVAKSGTQTGVSFAGLVLETYTEDFSKSTVNHMNLDTNTWEVYPIITGNKINSVTNSSLTTFVSNLPAAMFLDPNDSSVDLILSGDTVLIELPENHLTYDTTQANYTTFDISEIGGDGETAAYNAHDVTITTSEQLRNYVYSYLSGEPYDGVEGHVATSEVINELIDLYMDVLEVKWKQDIYNRGTWDGTAMYGRKYVVETVTDVNTQISVSDYLDILWQNDEGEYYDGAVTKFTSRPSINIIQEPIPVLENTVITWPTINS